MRTRFFIAFLLVAIFSIGVMSIIMATETSRQVRAYMYGGGMNGAESIVTSLEEYYSENDSWSGVAELLSTPGNGMGHGHGGMMHQSMILADAGGVVVVDTGGSTEGTSLSSSELASSITLTVDGSTVGYLLVDGGMTLAADLDTPLIERLNVAALVAGAVGVVAALLCAWFLSSRLLRPVKALTTAAQRLSKGDLTQRVPVQGKDELALLGTSFNSMADSLQSSEERRKAMIADIAHELRNPLTVQRAQVEAMQDGIEPATAENLQKVLNQSLVLEKLVEDLRTLALADAGELPMAFETVNLNTFLVTLVERQSAAAQKMGRVLICQPAQGTEPVVRADPLRLEQIIGNLLNNAIRYTPEGGEIQVSLTGAPGKAQIHVRDSGPGISPEALPYVFDRFYRADRSRSRDEGGSGLGLAIARKLAEAQGGTLTAANAPQGGAEFILSLPLNGE